MFENITPGSKVVVKVVNAPTNKAATKTIIRLLSKSTPIKEHNKRLAKARKEGFRQARRGGRFWDIHVVKQRPVEGVAGETQTITATLDVLTDLKSVSRFVEVTPAA